MLLTINKKENGLDSSIENIYNMHHNGKQFWLDSV